MQRRLVRRRAGDVEVLAADHAERRLCKLTPDLRKRIRQRQPERLRKQRVAREDGNGLAELGPGRRPAAPLGVVVECRQVVVHERERMDEL